MCFAFEAHINQAGVQLTGTSRSQVAGRRSRIAHRTPPPHAVCSMVPESTATTIPQQQTPVYIKEDNKKNKKYLRNLKFPDFQPLFEERGAVRWTTYPRCCVACELFDSLSFFFLSLPLSCFFFFPDCFIFSGRTTRLTAAAPSGTPCHTAVNQGLPQCCWAVPCPGSRGDWVGKGAHRGWIGWWLT